MRILIAPYEVSQHRAWLPDPIRPFLDSLIKQKGVAHVLSVDEEILAGILGYSSSKTNLEYCLVTQKILRIHR
jgi:hypothetical protein